jgi:hypothetical protein
MMKPVYSYLRGFPDSRGRPGFRFQGMASILMAPNPDLAYRQALEKPRNYHAVILGEAKNLVS